MEFLVLLPFLVSTSLLLPSLGLAVSGQEAHQLVRLHEPSQSGVHVPVAPTDLLTVSASVLGAESWLRAHVLAYYPTKRITSIVVGQGVACTQVQGLFSLRLLRAVSNLHHALMRWGLAEDIKVTVASTAACAKDRGILERRLYGRHHLPPTSAFPPPAASTYAPPPPPPAVPLAFAPNAPPELVPSVPPSVSAPASSPITVPASPPPVVSASPPTSTPASPPVVAPSALLRPCLAPQVAATSPPPPQFGVGGKGGGGLWCVAKPTVPEDKLQDAMDYACGQDGVDCQAIAAGGSCFYPDNLPSHASYAFNSYWQKTRQIGGSCDFGGTAVLINSDPSYLQCHFMLG